MSGRNSDHKAGGEECQKFIGRRGYEVTTPPDEFLEKFLCCAKLSPMVESPEQTIIREIGEELAFSLDVSKLQYIRRHHDGDVVSHMFLYPVTDEMVGAQLLEGQRFEFLSVSDLVNRDVVPPHRDILEWYARQKTLSA